MLTRSKSKTAPTTNPVASSISGKPCEGSTKTKSSRSSATVKAQKAAAEALALRRQLEREEQLAAEERDRARNLANLKETVERYELVAELAAIDAEAESIHSKSNASRRSSQVSVNRTENWVDAVLQSHCPDTADRPSMAAREQRQSDAVLAPDQHAVQPLVTRATAPLSSDPLQKTSNFFKASEAAAVAPPLLSAELWNNNSSLFKAVADTAAAAKALAVSNSTKKIERTK
uniref:Uncharacterized protein n=1 Tax=Heliothis virescens TaxID=7102 RepID=A0A2A4J164_HELVI